jgi:glutathione S-transferase
MAITIAAFEKSPDGGMGLARDTRVRWALEEAGQPYNVRLVSFQAMKEPAHLALHPFGQIPTYEEGDLALFETGSIVLHIAERHAGLQAGVRGATGGERAELTSRVTFGSLAFETLRFPVNGSSAPAM